MDADIFFAAGDEAPVVTDTLAVGGLPIDLTGATVTFRYSKRDGTSALIVSESATIVLPATDGNVEWQPVAALAPGDFLCEWRVVLASGDQLTVPNDRHLLMRVKGPPPSTPAP